MRAFLCYQFQRCLLVEPYSTFDCRLDWAKFIRGAKHTPSSLAVTVQEDTVPGPGGASRIAWLSQRGHCGKRKMAA
jgi:hypothetical protein